jgi:DNA repair protein RecN (Recombination protein N)
MLKTLYIKNFALIDELTVGFDFGLNIITGETGAGKSILIDALGLVLGERADAGVVRKGADKAVIEILLDATNDRKLKSLFDRNTIEPADELLLRREISAKGTSRSFVNDSPVTMAVLREIGDMLIDLHGQHEHQSLLKVATHVRLLDEYGGLGGLVEEFQKSYASLKKSKAELTELLSREKVLREKRELYSFQVREIDLISPQPNEEADLETEQSILDNSEKLFSATSRLYEMLYEADESVHNKLVEARNLLQDLARIDKSFADVTADATSAQALVDEITKFIQNYNSRIEFNSERLEEVRERLGAIYRLKKKYGKSLAEVLLYREQIARELELAENFESEIAKLEKKIESERKQLSDRAVRLSQKRHDIAKRLSKVIEDELKLLGIANGRFDVTIDLIEDAAGDADFKEKRYAVSDFGMDKVEFFISTNIGEDAKPLVKVASGGEVSRVMLALKTVLAKSDRLPILIFDEIDTGISGRIAQAVGMSLKDLAKYHQIIAITHLPQIAAAGDVHFRIEKVSDKHRTFSQIKRLTKDEHKEEVAKLLSGSLVTPAGLKIAEELINAGEKQ